jgi:putative DeoR family transcriptional regulator (stage III sporulation protein D)
VEFIVRENLRTDTEIEKRVLMLAEYIIREKATVRQAAAYFGVSKSTVHKDVTQRLACIKPSLVSDVRCVLDVNKSERHIRGGLATRKKYKNHKF